MAIEISQNSNTTAANILLPMRRIVGGFCILWAVYCLMTTGSQVIHASSLYNLGRDPAKIQNNADGIFNRGARATKNQYLVRENQAGFYAEGDGLKSLALTYWLYPTEFIPYSTDPIDVVFSKPPEKVMYFIVSPATYAKYSPTIPSSYTLKTIARTNSQVFVRGEKL